LSTSTNPPVRIGFIGCGGISHWHVQRLAKVPEAKIVALCDTSSASLDRMISRFPELAELPRFSDYREMLASDVAIDGVQLHSPHTLHFQQSMDSLDAGKHVLSEKPMVCTVEHAHTLLRKIEETGKVFAISYQRHYERTFRYIKQKIDEGELGDVQFVSVLQGQDWLRGTRGSWRQTLALSGGGQLNDSGSHLLDILLWVTGLQAKEVCAYSENFDSEVDINTAAAITFTNGARGTISVMGNCPLWWEDVTITGSKAAIFMRQGKLSWAAFGDKGPREVPQDEMPEGSDPDRNWVEAIAYGRPVGTPAICGLRVIELTEAAWKSAETGRPVQVARLG
jgi:predicted dehydrogenase